MTPMHAILSRFLAASDGGAAATYMILTAIWFLIVATGVQFMTPSVTTKMQAVSKTLQAYR